MSNFLEVSKGDAWAGITTYEPEGYDHSRWRPFDVCEFFYIEIIFILIV